MALARIASRRSEIVHLAIAEGHDADIPTNDGTVEDGEGSPVLLKSPSSALEKDIEKEAATPVSSRHSLETIPKGRTSVEEADPNIVWWDSEDDPENPLNWKPFRKWGAVAIVSAVTFLVPFGSSIVAPAIGQIMDEFNSTNELLTGFTVSVYVLGFAFGPLVIAPMSEMFGRLPLYHTCNIVFVVFNILCAISKNLTMLIVMRFFAGSVGSSPLTLGGGTIADVIPREQRATAMSVWVLGPTLGPFLGPIVGGFVSDALGWRWNFWIMSIAAGAGTILGIVLMKETYAPTILERKAKRLRKATGNPSLKSKLDTGLTTKDLFLYSIVRPTKMLLFAPIVLFLSIYVAVTYAYLYMFFTTMSEVFENQYHFKHNLVGLSFSGIGAGQFFGQFIYSWSATKSFKIASKKGPPKPEVWLKLMIVGAIVIPVGLFWYGWSVQANVHWLCPIVGSGLFSFGLLFIFMPASTYLVDVYEMHAASAMAANTVLRSALAAVLPLAGPKMYAKLGYGWGTSVLGFIAILLVPIPFVFIKYGERLRTTSTLKL